jgi:regulatory protein
VLPSPEADAAETDAPPARTRDPFERALEALSHRERTTTELAGWLSERGYTPAQVEDALSRLIEVGEVDDERFARRYAEDKRELRGWGSDRIREALAAKGLASDLIETALALDSESELDRAVALLERRGQRLDDERARSRALAFLARRGYDVDVAYEAVRGYERLAS